MQKTILFLALSTLISTAQAQTQDQSQLAGQNQGGSTNVSTTGPASVQSTGASDNSSSSGNATYTDVGRTNSTSGSSTNSQLTNQTQSQSTSGAANTSSGTANTASGAASSNAGSTTSSGNINSENTSINKARAYTVAVARHVSSTTPMNCMYSESSSFDILFAAASKSVSKADPFCQRQIVIQNICKSAVSAYNAANMLAYEVSLENAARLQCADKLVSDFFDSPKACAADMKFSTCSIEFVKPTVKESLLVAPPPVAPPAPTPIALPVTPVVDLPAPKAKARY